VAEGMATLRGQFSLPSEYRAAIDRLVAAARRRICIFDRDLVGAGFDEPARFDALRRFLLASRDSRIEIVLHEIRAVECAHPRLLLLLRQFSHAVSIHRTEAEARGICDSIMVADALHFVHRFHFDHARGSWGLNEPVEAEALARRFAEIWHTSQPAITATVLGL